MQRLWVLSEFWTVLKTYWHDLQIRSAPLSSTLSSGIEFVSTLSSDSQPRQSLYSMFNEWNKSPTQKQLSSKYKAVFYSTSIFAKIVPRQCCYVVIENMCLSWLSLIALIQQWQLLVWVRLSWGLGRTWCSQLYGRVIFANREIDFKRLTENFLKTFCWGKLFAYRVWLEKIKS